jgi:hypothetical protein
MRAFSWRRRQNVMVMQLTVFRSPFMAISNHSRGKDSTSRNG